MKFTAKVTGADGAPVLKAAVELVSMDGKRWAGRVSDGKLALDAEPSAVWGLLIDDAPVMAVPVEASANEVDLGEIVLVKAGVTWPVFHARADRVYGVPRAVVAQTGAEEAPSGRDVKRAGLSLGELLGSTAQQLTQTAPNKVGLRLTSANVLVKGIPTATGDAFGLEFPTREVAATGAGLSEVAFTLKPESHGNAPAPPTSGIEIPNLVGYTRDLASRKLATLGLSGEFTNQVVQDENSTGRVLRMLPRAGTRVPAQAVVRLFIGAS